MKTFIALIVICLLSSCQTYKVFKEGTKSEGAKAADEVDKVAIYTICKGNTRGSLTRNWMDTQSHFDLWVKLCLKGPDIDVEIEESEVNLEDVTE